MEKDSKQPNPLTVRLWADNKEWLESMCPVWGKCTLNASLNIAILLARQFPWGLILKTAKQCARGIDADAFKEVQDD